MMARKNLSKPILLNIEKGRINRYSKKQIDLDLIDYCLRGIE